LKLFFDENLSRKLPARLADIYPDSVHASEVDLIQAPDLRIWQYAKEHEFVLVSTDRDFFQIARQLLSPPKLIWLRRWTRPTRDAEAILRSQALRIYDFSRNSKSGVLILDAF